MEWYSCGGETGGVYEEGRVVISTRQVAFSFPFLYYLIAFWATFRQGNASRQQYNIIDFFFPLRSPDRLRRAYIFHYNREAERRIINPCSCQASQ